MRLACRFVMKVVSRLALAIPILAMSGCTEVQDREADDDRDRFLSGPLVIEDQGSFFVGGVPKITNYATLPAPGNPNQTLRPAQIMIGQMYVQFQIPAEKKPDTPPVIMVHGSAHTGAALESTPDGREGWRSYFVRNGISTYIVDQSGRGRSGFDQSVIHEAAALIRDSQIEEGMSMLPRIGTITNDRAWTAWFGHLVPQGSTVLTGELIRHGDPGDPDGDDDNHTDGYLPAFPIEAFDPQVAVRAGAIAEAPRGPNDYLALEYYKQLVPNTEATLPGSTCASCDPMNVSPANTWTPLNLAALVERLGGAIVATHSQSGAMGHHMVRILKERGQLDLVKGLITLEGSCSLTATGLVAADFDNIPYMTLKGDYAGTSAACQSTVDAIQERRTAGQGSAAAEYIKLDELGDPAFDGTTHMLMTGTNHLEVADVILGWVDENVPPEIQ